MTEVNEAPVKQKRTGKKVFPVSRRRVVLSVRVLPATMDYLKKMNYRTTGRALDVLIKAIQRKEIREMFNCGSAFTIVDLSSGHSNAENNHL